ncbi:hypothetical protein [Streptomyces sp. NPDC059761]|uniref:hypothetical protein n=1 Tax=Streptomyces sp. NPDC059761 TaxID=3346937 RepID=UPI003657F248
MQNPGLLLLPDLTDAPVFTMRERVRKLLEGMDLGNEYYGESGYGRETWNRISDALSREAMGSMMVLAGPAHPYMARDYKRAVTESAGIMPREGGMREVLQQQLGKGLLMSVLPGGQHHMAEPEKWPDELPATVLGAVRNAELHRCLTTEAAG